MSRAVASESPGSAPNTCLVHGAAGHPGGCGPGWQGAATTVAGSAKSCSAGEVGSAAQATVAKTTAIIGGARLGDASIAGTRFRPSLFQITGFISDHLTTGTRPSVLWGSRYTR